MASVYSCIIKMYIYITYSKIYFLFGYERKTL